MTNYKRNKCREVQKFLTSKVCNKGNKDFRNFKFSFKDLCIVERDDKIRASKGKPVKKLAKEVKLSRNQVYTVLRRK